MNANQKSITMGKDVFARLVAVRQAKGGMVTYGGVVSLLLDQYEKPIAALAQPVAEAEKSPAPAADSAPLYVREAERVKPKPEEAILIDEMVTKKDLKIMELERDLATKMVPVPCPHCKEKDTAIALKDEKVNALTQQLKTKAEAPVDIPDLGAIIAHCEDGKCPDHAAQWNGIKKDIVKAAYENMPPELVEQKGEALNLIPKRIIITRR